MAKRGRRGGKRWVDLRARAFSRDQQRDARCWICGMPIDYSLPISSCGEAYEADHYIPIASHPELEYDIANLRPSHRHCNRSRQDRASTSLLGVPSRDWRRKPKG